MNRKSKIVISITGIVLVTLILVSLTYAYFLTRIQGNTNTRSISVTTADLQLVYLDGNGLITAEKIIPGTTIDSKTFSVTNTGNASVEYGVFLEDLVNNFERTSDLSLIVTCTSNITGHTCDGYSGTMPTENIILLTNTIDAEDSGVDAEVHTYSLTLEYIEAGVDQSVDMNKELSAKVNIYGLIDTVDLSGTISDTTSGDYVVVNSDPKVSQIKNGTFKVVGLEPGTHTINVYHSDDTPSYSKTITINKGASEAISGETATVIDDTRLVVANVGENLLDILKIYDIDHLSYNILNNSIIQKNGTKYTHVPLTVPGEEMSLENEKELLITEDDLGSSYYFRGNVADNYVKFANKCWRIVRIEGDDAIKIILENKNNNCNSTSYQIANGGTYYGYINSNIADYLNATNGLNQRFSDWYNSSIKNNYENYLKEDTWCLGDNENVYDSNGVSKTKSGFYYYSAYKRLLLDKNPSLECDGGEFNSYFATLTADEIVFAGGLVSIINNNYSFSHYLGNGWFWSLNLSHNPNSGDYAFANLHGTVTNGCRVNYGYHVDRIAVTLKSNTKISTGDGTKTNPYVIN